MAAEPVTQVLPGSGDPTTALPAFPPDEPQTEVFSTESSRTTVMPAVGAQGYNGGAGEPASRTTVMPAASRHWAGDQPQYQAEPAWRPEPESDYRPDAPADPPVRLPRPPQRRRTAALPLGAVMLLVTVGLLGWGTYTFLTSVHVFEVAQGETGRLDLTAAGAVIGGAVLALITVITALVAVSRSKPKTAACALLLGALLLPLGAVAAGGYYGGQELKDRTMVEAHDVVGQIDPQAVDQLLGRVEALGIDVPWREELVRILQGGGH